MSDLRNPQAPGMGSGTGQPQAIPRPGMGQAAQPGLRPPVQPGGIRPPVATPTPGAPARPGITAPPAMRPPPQVDDSIALVEEIEELPASAATPHAPEPSKIKFGPDISHKKHDWKRKPHVTGAGAIRVKSFHAKYSDQGIERLDDQINEWLDEHPEVEVKFATQTVHVFEGKIREPAIVMNVWY